VDKLFLSIRHHAYAIT